MSQPQHIAAKKRWLAINIMAAIAMIMAGLGVLFYLGQQPQSSQANTILGKQQPAPNFTLPNLDGAPIQLSDYAGQVVLINTWATWCPPCKAEMPTLETYYLTHQDEGFVVLAVNSQEPAAEVRQFIEANKFTFPVLLDQQNSVLSQYNVLGLPTSIIIDRDGIVRYTHTGEITHEQLERVVGPLL